MKYRTIVSSVAIAVSLAGCSAFHNAKQFQNSTMSRINRLHAPNSEPVVTNFNAPYIGGSMVRLEQAPPPMLRDTKIQLISQRPLTVQDIASKIEARTGILVVDNVISGKSGGGGGSLPAMPGMSATPSIGSSGSGNSVAIAIDYDGSVEGLLNYMKAKYQIWWRFRNGEVELYNYETKTFSINMTNMPLGEATKIVANAGGALGDTSLGGMTSSSSGTQNNGSTNITVGSTTDLWKNVDETATVLAGPGAKVAINPDMDTLTVYGLPPQVDRIRDWVKRINKSAAQQIGITVHIYSVQLTHEQNYGFNPQVAFNQLSKQYGFTLSGPSLPPVVSGDNPFSLNSYLGQTANPAFQQFSGSTAAVQALATLGNVTETFEQNLVTMNHQPVPLQVAQNTGYLAESQTTQTANVGATNSLVPGNITTGFTGVFTPSLVNGRIMMTMNITLSALQKLTQESSGGSSIQVPTSTNSEFAQSVSLRPGETLLLTGYKQHQDQTQHNGVGSAFFPLLGGGADANNSNQMIAITITARTLGR